MAATNYSARVIDTSAAAVNRPFLSGRSPGNDDIATWTKFFGPPPVKQQNFGEDIVETHQDLYKIYEGQNLYLSDTITGLILSDTAWETSVLPWLETDQMHITFNRFEFKNTLATPVPYEGIPRLIVNSGSTFSDSVHRLGIGFIMEADALSTPEGLNMYNKNLAQISQSSMEAVKYASVVKLLVCKDYEKERQDLHRPNDRATERMEEKECEYFGIMSVNREGFARMVEDYRATMRAQQADPDTLIMFPRFQMFEGLIAQGTYTEYWQTGPGGIAFLKEGPIAPGNYRGLIVYETREFNAYTNGLRFNPLLRRVTIGEHYLSVFGQWRGTRLPKDFSNKWRALQLYDIISNDWALVDFLSMFKHANLFGNNQTAPDSLNPNVQRLADIHNEQFKDDFNSEAEKYAPANLQRLDNLDGNSFPGRRVFFMLAHNAEKRRVDPVRTFGEFDIDVANTSDFVQTAETIIDKAFTDEDERTEIRAGLVGVNSLVKDLEAQEYNADFAIAIAAFNSRKSINAAGFFEGEQPSQDEPIDWSPNKDTGWLDLPPVADSGKLAYPVGFASYGGIATLATQGTTAGYAGDLVTRAILAKEALDKIVDKFDTLLKDTKVFNKSNIPAWFHTDNPAVALFVHLWPMRPPLYLAVNVNAPAGDANKGRPPTRQQRDADKKKAAEDAAKKGKPTSETVKILWSPIDRTNPLNAVAFPDIFPRARYIDALIHSTPASTADTLINEMAGSDSAGGRPAATNVDKLLTALLNNVPTTAANASQAARSANEEKAQKAEEARNNLINALLALLKTAKKPDQMPTAVEKLRAFDRDLAPLTVNANQATPELIATLVTQVNELAKNVIKDATTTIAALTADQKTANEAFGNILWSIQVGTAFAIKPDGSTPAGRGGRNVMPFLADALPEIQKELTQPAGKTKKSKNMLEVHRVAGEKLEEVGRALYPITKTLLTINNYEDWVNTVVGQDSLSQEQLNEVSQAYANYKTIIEETERRAQAKFGEFSSSKQSHDTGGASMSLDALDDDSEFDQAAAYPTAWAGKLDAKSGDPPKAWFRSPLVNSPALMKSLAAQADMPRMLPSDPRSNYRTVYAPWRKEGTNPAEPVSLDAFTEVTMDPMMSATASASLRIAAKPFTKTPWISSLLKRSPEAPFFVEEAEQFRFSPSGQLFVGVVGGRNNEKFDVNQLRTEARSAKVHFADVDANEAAIVSERMKQINKARLLAGQPMRDFSSDFATAKMQMAQAERELNSSSDSDAAAFELSSSNIRDANFNFGGSGVPLAAGAAMMFDPINRAQQFSRQMASAGKKSTKPIGAPFQTGIWRGDRDNSNVQYDTDRLQREQTFEEEQEAQFRAPRDWMAADPRFYGDYRDYRYGVSRGPGYAPQGYYPGEFGVDPHNPTFGVHGVYTWDQNFYNRSGVGPGGGRPDRTWPGQFAPAPAEATEDYMQATHPNVEYRYRKAQEHSDPLVRLGMLALIHMPNTWKAWIGLIKKELHAPINLIVWRLNIELEMHTALMMVAGPETGANVVGKAGAAISGSVADRMVYASYVFHHAAMVWNEKNIVHLRDVQFGGYIAGLDTTYVMTRKELKSDERGSLIVTAIPITENRLPARLNFVDTTVTRLLPSQTNRTKTIDSVPDYSSARYYQELWGYNESYLNHTRATNRYHMQSQRVNVRSSEGKHYSGGPNNMWKLHKGQGQLAGKKMGPGVRRVLFGTGATMLEDDTDPAMRQF